MTNPTIYSGSERILKAGVFCTLLDLTLTDDTQIKDDFNELYHLMNGMELRDMDKIIYPVCKLCRDHERSGFVEGVKMGIMLAHELG